MKFIFLGIITSFIFMLTFQTVEAQAIKKIPAKEISLITHLVKEANQPDSHSVGDVYLLVTIGKSITPPSLDPAKLSVKKTRRIRAADFTAIMPKSV